MVKEILDILLPIYACAGLGFALGRFGVAWDAKPISPLVLQVAFPLLVILMSILPAATINILMGQEAGADLEPLTIFVTCTNLWLVVSLPIALVLLL